MSTNYYAVIDACSCCGRSDELHIGKSSGGLHCPVTVDDDGAVVGPTSWAEWKVRLRQDDVDGVRDEYGRVFTVDQFIAEWEDPGLAAARRAQYDWLAENDPKAIAGGPTPGKTWLDPEGWTVTARSFS